MSALYVRLGSNAEPAPLPARFVDDDGVTHTHLDARTPQQIAGWGFRIYDGSAPGTVAGEGEVERWDAEAGKYVAEPAPAGPGPQPRPLSVIEYEGLVEAVTQMTPAQYMAWETDSDPRAYQVRSKLVKVTGQIERDHPMVAAGLGVMDDLGHRGTLDAGTLTAAVMGAWPTA